LSAAANIGCLGRARLYVFDETQICVATIKGNLVMHNRFGTAACWLLLIPYIGLLWVPFYNRHDPVLLGFPFFYWYQLAWVPLTAIITWIAYRSMRHDD
jgi:hypothetical protein